ncbi:MAG: DUF5615 family PIN-like protein [Burkholderiales bacterium]|nr:DUF5615 family PIN-like protein [Phycisphaerae bacterium]
MRIKIDEDLSENLKPSFLQAGYDVASVRDQGWSGLSDQDLWIKVQAEQEFLVTADVGFSDIRVYAPGTHNGILVLRSRDQLISSFITLVESVLSIYALNEHVGHLIIASDQGIRVRKR